MIVLDASGLLAAIVADEPRHEEARTALEREPPPRVLSPFVLAELDYLIGKRRGTPAQIALLADVESGSYELSPFGVEDVVASRRVLERYPELGVGLTDASIVVLAERYDTNRVLTLDERHFRALRTASGEPFTLLPTDA